MKKILFFILISSTCFAFDESKDVIKKIVQADMPKVIYDALENKGVSYDEKTSKLTFEEHSYSPKETSWILVHDGKKVISLFEAGPHTTTYTINKMFSGTEKECQSEIKRLNLIQLEVEDQLKEEK